MELDEMKDAWTEMSVQIEKQKKLTNKLILTMTQEQYKNKLSKIRTPEMIASVICVAEALLILVNFNKFQTGYLITCSIVSIVLLFLMPALTIAAIYKMDNLNIIESDYKKILTDYAKGKSKLLNAQKLNFYLGFVLLITILPVMVRIMGGKDVPLESNVWFWYLPFGFLFFILFAKWVYGYYVRTTIQTEKLLKELNADS